MGLQHQLFLEKEREMLEMVMEEVEAIQEQ